jgi:hypothetical protein
MAQAYKASHPLGFGHERITILIENCAWEGNETNTKGYVYKIGATPSPPSRVAQTLCFQFPLRLLVIFGSVHTVLSRKVSTSDNEVTWKSTVVIVG